MKDKMEIHPYKQDINPTSVICLTDGVVIQPEISLHLANLSYFRKWAGQWKRML